MGTVPQEILKPGCMYQLTAPIRLWRWGGEVNDPPFKVDAGECFIVLEHMSEELESGYAKKRIALLYNAQKAVFRYANFLVADRYILVG